MPFGNSVLGRHSSAGATTPAAALRSSDGRIRASVPRARLVGAWLLGHATPFALVPVLTHGIGSRFGLDAAAATSHAISLVLLSLVQGTVLARVTDAHALTWAWRSLLGLATAFAVAMVLMSTIDRAGYDAAATPIAMAAGGSVYGIALGWPLVRTRIFRAWVTASALGWLLGAGAYRLLLAYALDWSIAGRSAYGYAYTGGHNELLWMGTGLACFGLTTSMLLRRSRALQWRMADTVGP